MVAAKASLTVIYPAELPDFRVEAWEFSDNHWEMLATRDNIKLVTSATTYDQAMKALISEYNHYDGWPLSPKRLDPPDPPRVPPDFAHWPIGPGRSDQHSTVAPAAWRGLKQEKPKLTTQPNPFELSPLQDMDKLVAEAKAERAEMMQVCFRKAWRWLREWWLGLVLFVLIVGVLAAFHGEWSAKVWVETIR